MCVGGCVRVCVCRGVLCGGCNLSVHGFHHREVMRMAEATNDGVRERKCPYRGKRRCVRVREVNSERTCLFERHRGRLLYVDGACRRELNEGMVLLVLGI